MPGVQSTRFNELMLEMVDAQQKGDTKRMEEIGKEMEALSKEVQQEFQQVQQDPAKQNVTPFYNPDNQTIKETPEIKLGLAARKGDLESVKSLVASGAKLNTFNLDPGPPLMEAAVNGHLNIAEYLLTHGAQIQVKSGLVTLDALRFAAEAKEDNSAMLRLLAKNGALDKQKVDSLASAMVKNAEQSGAGPSNIRSDQLMIGSALIAAIEKNRNTHVVTLLELGSEPNDWSHGKTALMIAAKKLQANTVENLLKHGADAKLTSPEGKTALQFAMETKANPRNEKERERVITLLQKSR